MRPEYENVEPPQHIRVAMSCNSTETPSDVFNDDTDLAGSTVVTGVAYGVVLALYCICANLLVKRITTDNRRRTYFFLTYISTMFILGTFYVASNAWTAQISYVNNRYFPGGPAAYNLIIFSDPTSILGVASYIIANWMADALMLWRSLVLYRGSRYLILIAIFPCLLYMASFSMGLLTLIQSSLPTQSFWSQIAISFGLPYYALSISLTLISTGLILGRLLFYRRRFRNVLGPDYGKEYTGIAAIVVESSALYAVWSIIFIVLYGINHPVQLIFLASLAEIQIICPLLIIFRVSQGKAWKSSTSSALVSSLQIGSKERTPKSELVGRSHSARGADHLSSATVFELSQVKTVSNDRESQFTHA